MHLTALLVFENDLGGAKALTPVRQRGRPRICLMSPRQLRRAVKEEEHHNSILRIPAGGGYRILRRPRMFEDD